jgi:hypothetical protein
MSFSSRIRDREDFPWRHIKLELGLCFVIVGRMEGVGRAGAGRVLALLALPGRDAGWTWGGSWVRVGPCENRKGGGKEEASWAGLRFQLGFSPLLNRNSKNPFLFQIFFIICKLI